MPYANFAFLAALKIGACPVLPRILLVLCCLFNKLTCLCFLSPHLNPLQSSSRDCLVCAVMHQNWQLISVAQKAHFCCLHSVVSEPCHRICTHFSKEAKCCRDTEQVKQQAWTLNTNVSAILKETCSKGLTKWLVSPPRPSCFHWNWQWIFGVRVSNMRNQMPAKGPALTRICLSFFAKLCSWKAKQRKSMLPIFWRPLGH